MPRSIVQEKSFQFSLDVIDLYRGLKGRGESILSRQVLRSGTSIGANVEEALAAQSQRDFHAKMTIASKEARETRYWLRLLQESQLVKVDCLTHLQRVDELVRLLTAITKTAARNMSGN